jgi:uncharacterized membrane protein YfbV (UPF0208 family)
VALLEVPENAVMSFISSILRGKFKTHYSSKYHIKSKLNGAFKQTHFIKLFQTQLRILPKLVSCAKFIVTSCKWQAKSSVNQ